MKIVTDFVSATHQYTAVDEDSYDGGPDSKTRSQVGWGISPQAAIDDLKEQLELCTTVDCTAEAVGDEKYEWDYCAQCAEEKRMSEADALHDQMKDDV